jgi:hypothetical protein
VQGKGMVSRMWVQLLAIQNKGLQRIN